MTTGNNRGAEWLALRRKLGWGGSEINVLLGESKYRSKYSLFLEKLGRFIPEDISDQEAVRLGHDLEEYVASRWEERTGKKCRRVNYILQDMEKPFAYANIDRKVVHENAGLEIKTTSSYDVLSECKNGFPSCYRYQCLHYMMVAGFEKYYLAVLVFGRGLFTFELNRADVIEEIEALEAVERYEWSNVVMGILPAPDGSESTKEALNAANASGKIDIAEAAEAESRN